MIENTRPNSHRESPELLGNAGKQLSTAEARIDFDSANPGVHHPMPW
jgi:hypothetical protein